MRTPLMLALGWPAAIVGVALVQLKPNHNVKLSANLMSIPHEEASAVQIGRLTILALHRTLQPQLQVPLSETRVRLGPNTYLASDAAAELARMKKPLLCVASAGRELLLHCKEALNPSEREGLDLVPLDLAPDEADAKLWETVGDLLRGLQSELKIMVGSVEGDVTLTATEFRRWRADYILPQVSYRVDLAPETLRSSGIQLLLRFGEPQEVEGLSFTVKSIE